MVTNIKAIMTAQPAYAPPPNISASYADGPRLLADIGGTNARFALETAPGQVENIEVLPCASHLTLAHALNA